MPGGVSALRVSFEVTAECGAMLRVALEIVWRQDAEPLFHHSASNEALSSELQGDDCRGQAKRSVLESFKNGSWIPLCWNCRNTLWVCSTNGGVSYSVLSVTHSFLWVLLIWMWRGQKSLHAKNLSMFSSVSFLWDKKQLFISASFCCICLCFMVCFCFLSAPDTEVFKHQTVSNVEQQ